MYSPYSIEDYYSTGSDFLSQKIAFKYRLRPKFQRTNYISQNKYHDQLMFDLDNDMMHKKFWKGEFNHLRVVGQFNTGFIVCTLNKNDMFIFDQHACDERFNLERITGALKIVSQPLMRPIIAEIDKALYGLVCKYEKIFNDFGFKYIKIGESRKSVKIKVHSVPSSHDTPFEESDFHNLVTAVRNFDCDDQAKAKYKEPRQLFDYLMPRKVMQILALKACRQSVMVGCKLDKRRQREIVKNLNQLKSPWICAHGRPTMRYIMHIEDFRNRLNYKSYRRERKPPNLLLR